MNASGLLEHILERLSRAEPDREIIGVAETRQWPDGALSSLIKAEMLQPAQPARVIECDGCERNCFMPVHICAAENGRPARAFISCNKPEDMGRIRVELSTLGQWQITGGQLAKTLARLLGFTQAPRQDDADKRWTLGMLKGNEHKAQVVLALGNGVGLKVAGHDIPLVEVLTLNEGKLAVDKNELLRFVDKPAVPRGTTSYKPSVARREARKLDTQATYKSWQKEYRTLKKKRQNMTDVWYSQQIAKMDIANRRDAETIRKHMKK